MKTNGVEYEVNIHKMEGSTAYLTVNGVDYKVEVSDITAISERMNNEPKPQTKLSDVIVRKPVTSKGSQQITPPIPGILLDICVKEGDKIKTGQELFVLEAMKMENSIQADREGIVEKIYRAKGDSVLEGDTILVIS